MLQPNLTVIEGGNPDDQYVNGDLQLVSQPAPTANASIPLPLPLKIIDALATILSHWRFRVELLREKLQQERVALRDKHDRMIGGREW